MFDLSNDWGFGLTFANGLRLSVVFGDGTYSDHEKKENHRAGLKASTVEIAILSGKRFVTREICRAMGKTEPEDDVIGHLTLAEVSEFITYLSQH